MCFYLWKNIQIWGRSKIYSGTWVLVGSWDDTGGTWVLVGGWDDTGGTWVLVGGIGVPWDGGGICELGGIPGVPSGEPSNGICVLVGGSGGDPWDEGGICELGGIPGDVSWGDPWGGANGWPSGNPSGDIFTWAYMIWWSPLSTARKITEIPATNNKKLRYIIIILFNIFIYSLCYK